MLGGRKGISAVLWLERRVGMRPQNNFKRETDLYVILMVEKQVIIFYHAYGMKNTSRSQCKPQTVEGAGVLVEAHISNIPGPLVLHDCGRGGCACGQRR